MKLLCFSHAGGDGQSFRTWREFVPGWIEITPVVLPGRASRYGEAALETFQEALERLWSELQFLRGETVALFGHSLGALLAYELAGMMLEAKWEPPRHLFVSGCPAPHLHHPSGLSTLDDAAFERWIISTQSLPIEEEHLLEEMLEIVSPVVRADMKIYDSYTYRPRAAYPLDLTALAGSADADAPPPRVAEWTERASGCTAFRVVDGDHFFPSRLAPQVAGLVTSTIVGSRQ